MLIRNDHTGRGLLSCVTVFLHSETLHRSSLSMPARYSFSPDEIRK